jgi:RNA polymerase sigma factor (sigma-70 family)
MLGAMQAVNRYNYREHGRFVHYVTAWIWQKVGRAVKNHSTIIRIPVHFHEILEKVAEAYRHTVLSGDMEMPSVEEVAVQMKTLESMEVSSTFDASEDAETLSNLSVCENGLVEKVKLALSCLWPHHPLQEEIPYQILREISAGGTSQIGDSLSLGELIPADSSKDPVVIVERQDAAEWAREALGSLSIRRRDREIVALRFGIQDGQERTLEEVGREYGLTRERIRQIEAKALKQLSLLARQEEMNNYYHQFSSSLQPALFGHLVRNEHKYLLSRARDLDRGNDVLSSLDRWLEELPSGTPFGHDASRETRRSQLERVLRSFEQPTYYGDIAQELDEESPNTSIAPDYVYSLLSQSEDIFILLGEGVFSLVSWERERAREKEPVLPYCASPLLSSNGEPYSFFESAIVARRLLKDEPTAKFFLDQITSWAGIEEKPSEWLCQSYLTAYYLIDLIPYVFFPDDHSQILHCTLPENDIQGIRNHCLEAINRRLVAMPEFWWLLRVHQPISITQISEKLSEAHPADLDDAGQRLTILTSFGAITKEYAQYKLTQLGEKLADTWATRPHTPDISSEMSEKSTLDTDVWLDISDLA